MRYPTKTPGCRRWISSCAPAWAFSASAASPVRWEILYLKCERSDENEPLLRRRELLEKQGQRFGLRQIRRAVERGELPARLDVELASIYLQSLWDGICGTLAWTERLRDDPWNRAERMFRAGLDSLRSSPYLLLADA